MGPKAPSEYTLIETSYDFDDKAEKVMMILCQDVHMEDKAMEAWEEMLDVDDISQYIPYYLDVCDNENSRYFLTYYQMPHRKKLPDSSEGLMSFEPTLKFKRFQFEGETFGPGPRHRVIYPLTSQEFQKARSYIQENPEFHVALAMLQDCLSCYMAELRNVLLAELKRQGMDDKYNTVLVKGIASNAIGPSFVHDLGPHLAFSLSENGGVLTPGSMYQGLRHLFARDVFTSAKGNREARCPFSRSFAKVSAMRVEEKDDGTYFAQDGQLGDLIRFFMKQARERFPRDELEALVAENMG